MTAVDQQPRQTLEDRNSVVATIASTSAGVVQVVVAAAGLGKTWVLERANAILDATAAHHITQRCEAPRSTEPFHAFAQLAMEVDDATTDRATAIADHLLNSISEVTCSETSLLVVDDVHWADGGTLEVLVQLARRHEQYGLGVVFASRPGPVVERLIASLEPSAVVAITLRPLDDESMSQL